MSQVRHTDADARQALSRLFAPIASDLALVDRRLQQELRHSDPFIDELAQHSFRIGGKRLRPALLLLTARAIGEVTHEHHTLAAVVEMVHTATLVLLSQRALTVSRCRRTSASSRTSSCTSVAV